MNTKAAIMNIKLLWALVLFAFAITSCTNTRTESTEKKESKPEPKDSITNTMNPSNFKIQKGINISHWLSQRFGWSPYETYITEDDIRLLDSLGFDHIRLPIEEEVLWDEDGKVIDSTLQYVKNCINWCIKYEMRTVVDLHILRSHHFNSRNNEGEMTLWNDEKAQDNFIQLWRNLSSHLKHYPDSMVAYEPMNEPVAPEHELWNKLITRCIEEIRKVEPNRVIVLGSNRWQKPHTYPYLEIPKNDKNIILSYHSYHPYFVTHYKAYWSPAKFYEGPVNYPGIPISQEDYNKYIDTTNKPLVDRVKEEKSFEFYNKEKLQEIAQPAIDKAKEYGLQLYCNEFGCLPNVPDSVRYNYYRDIKAVFEDNNIAFANWDYKGDFRTREWDRKELKNKELDTTLVNILIK